MQEIIPFEEIDPLSFMTPTTALVIALLSLGVEPPQAPAGDTPAFPFHEQRIYEVQGKKVRHHLWNLAKGADLEGTPCGEIIKRWNDTAWLAANPKHEITILRNGLMNAVKVAEIARKTVPRVVVSKRKGRIRDSVLIPANVSPEEREHWIGMLNGKTPPGAPFVAETADQAE